MFAYVLKDEVKVGDEVYLELHSSKGTQLSVIQVTKVRSVRPSPSHHESLGLDEVEF